MRKTFLCFAAGLSLFGTLCGTVKSYADEIRITPDANWIREGGVNRYDGVQAQNRQETEEIENRLRADGYFEIHSLTPEQYEAFVESEDSSWWFDRYIEFDDGREKYESYYDGWFKVYIFRPSFTDWWASYQERGNARDVDRIPKMEIENCTVVLDYRFWWDLDRVGKDLSDEMNDGIPEWCDVGYICIESPISAEIRLKLINEGTFYTVYVMPDKPFRAKMKYGNYVIDEINGVKINETDSNVVLNNNFQVGCGKNLMAETPLDIDIEKTVTAYNIPAKDISGMPDRSMDHNQNIPEERTVLEDTEEPIQTEHTNWFRRIFIILLIAVLLAGIGAYLYFDRRRKK